MGDFYLMSFLALRQDATRKVAPRQDVTTRIMMGGLRNKCTVT
jgi:hypothetical protein